jgi:hypothetical protein
MDRVIAVAGLTIVLAAATYLVVLGGSALFRPELAERFLGGHATTRTLHFLELALRIIAGAAFVISAPRLALGNAVAVLGWVLVGTSLALAIVPWRLHQRFAAWSVPQALQYLPMIGVASLAGGLGLLAAVVLPHVAA